MKVRFKPRDHSSRKKQFSSPDVNEVDSDHWYQKLRKNQEVLAMPHYNHRQLKGDRCVPGVGPFQCCDSGDRLITVQGAKVEEARERRFKNPGYKCNIEYRPVVALPRTFGSRLGFLMIGLTRADRGMTRDQ